MDDQAQETARAMAEQMLHLGEWQEARVLLKRLHKAQPRHTDTLLQLALAERFLKQWDEAIALLKKRWRSRRKTRLYREQLAMVLMFSNTGRNHREAIEQFAALLAQQPHEGPIASNLITLALRQDRPQAVLQAIAPLLALPLSDVARLHYASACAIAAYLLHDPAAAQALWPRRLRCSMPWLMKRATPSVGMRISC